MKRSILLFCFLSCCQCSGYAPSPKPVLPTEVAKTECEQAEKHLLDLACKDPQGDLLAGPTSDGTKFSVVCANALNSGSPIDPVCMKQLVSCDTAELKKCNRMATKK